MSRWRIHWLGLTVSIGDWLETHGYAFLAWLWDRITGVPED